MQTAFASIFSGSGTMAAKAFTAEALANLLKNAAEHTPPGGRVRVECSCQALYFEFRVQNQGPAIPKEELPRLFERFWRGASASPGSVGIGLPLARSIARGQQGDVTAENTPEGPLFRLRLFR